MFYYECLKEEGTLPSTTKKVKNNANLFAKLQQRVVLKMKTSSNPKIANAMEGDSIGKMN